MPLSCPSERRILKRIVPGQLRWPGPEIAKIAVSCLQQKWNNQAIAALDHPERRDLAIPCAEHRGR
jgi:hypothetical protein